MSRARILPVWPPILAACLFGSPAAALAQCVFATSGAGRVLTYTFEPAVTSAGTTLHVTLAFQGGPEGMDTVEVPSHWAGETLRGVTHLRAITGDTVLAEAASPGERLVRHPPNLEVTLAYDMVKDWTRLRHPAEFHGVLLPEYLEINGDNALVHPVMPSQTPVTVHFDWRLPGGWALATSFGTSPGGAGSASSSRCQSYSGAWSDVQHALFTAGEFRIHHFQIGARPAVLAVRGDWTFTDDEVIADIQKAVGIVRDFWHDDNFPYYLVTLKPFDEDKGDEDGSEFTNAFWLYLSRQDALSGTEFATLVHETFHTWNPRRMGFFSGEDYQALEWFREGFTQYYGYLLACRAGLIEFPAYIDNINRDLRDSPGSTNPYLRGRLIALWLNREIRRDSAGKSSLDNVMFDMVGEAAQPLTEARILATAGRYLSPDSQRTLREAVQPGARIPAAGDALGKCVHGSMDEIVPFDLGFDFAASEQAGRVISVAPNGPAFAAGLREGQEMVGYSVYHNQPDKAAKITIRTGDKRQTIEYFPRGRPLKVMQYHLDRQAYAGNPASCQAQ